VRKVGSRGEVVFVEEAAETVLALDNADAGDYTRLIVWAVESAA